MSIAESSNRAAPVLSAMLGATLLSIAPVVRCATPAKPAAPGAAVFGALPAFSDVQLSPNGRLLAWCDETSGTAKVVIFDLAAKAYRRTIDIDPALKERSLEWSDDGTLLVTLSDTNPPLWVHGNSFEMWRTLSVNVDSGETHMLLMGSEPGVITGALLLAWRTARPHTVVMETLHYALTAHREETGTRLVDARADSGLVRELYDVDTQTGNGTPLDQGDAYTAQWVLDARGTPVARSEWRPAEHRYLIEAKAGLGWRTILDRNDGIAMSLYGICPCGKAVLATAPDATGRIRLWAVALDGSGARELLPDPGADVESVVRDRFSGAPVGVMLGGLDTKIRYIDPITGNRNASVAHAFPGLAVDVYSRSEDGSRVIAKVEGPSHPPVYYLVDFNTHRADIVGEAYPGLDDAALGEVRNITYAARDGTAIPAYLTVPPGAVPKNLPMVVLPHGGPEARDDPGFDWLAQFFATRGYAVLQPEFRGSTGFGEAFERAGKGQWGGLMQEDVTDGVKAMIRQGIADPRRVCIVGGSYGGYAALAGAAFTPGLYACAVSINGVSDLPGLLMYERSLGGKETDAAAYWDEEIGAPSDPKVIAASPVNHAADVDTPVLLLHATDDTVVPFGQSQEMADALARLGKPVSLVKLTGEDHWLSRGKTRTEVLEDTESFLRKYLQ